MKVAAIQMVSQDTVSDNLAQAQTLLQQASQQGVDLAVLPENFAIFRAGSYLPFAQQEAMNPRVIPCVQEWAQAFDLWICVGSLPSVSGQHTSKVNSRSYLIDPTGQVQGTYNKIHLFDAEVSDAQGCYRESDQFVAGQSPCVLDVAGHRLGLAICYDLRFPELFRSMVEQGMQMCLLPSAFTATTGEAHWMALNRARAIENQCFWVAANQGGQHSAKRMTYGHSCVIDPWGRVLNCLEAGPGICVADIDWSLLQSVREQLPALKHRRLLY